MQWNSNLLGDLKKGYLEDLSSHYSNDEALALLNILIEHYFGLSRVKQVTTPDHRLTESEMLSLHFAVKELKKYKPVQYITGKTAFLDLDFFVNEHVLIPRPETEELVQHIIKKNKSHALHILDIGTGSGCIAVSLSKNFPDSHVTAIDVSERAIEIAAKNALNHEQDIALKVLDIFEDTRLQKLGDFDLIVSNPPYVTESEKALMQANVLDYEPEQALFVDDSDPLLYYDKIMSICQKHLVNQGKVYLEINESFGNEVVSLLKNHDFYDISLHKDIHNKDRYLEARKSKPA